MITLEVYLYVNYRRGRSVLIMDYIRENGQSIVEYAFILMLVVFVIIAVLVLLGPAIGNMYSNILNNYPS
jgi:pilus assembly protein Flp/PilA